MTNIRSKLFTLATVVMIAACGGTPTGTGDDMGGPPPPPPPPPPVILANPSFATDIQDIFVRNGCTASNCHGTNMSGGLGLANATESFGNLVNVAAVAQFGPAGLDRVQPNDIAASYLWLKISGTTAGQRMPLGGAALDNVDQTNIMNWINTGALNN